MDQTLTPLTVTTVHQHMCTICTHKSVYTSSTNYTSLSIYTSIWSIGTRIRSFTVGGLILESLHIARCTPARAYSSCYSASMCLRALTPLSPLPVKYTQASLCRRNNIQSLDRDLLWLLQHPDRISRHFLRKQRPTNTCQLFNPAQQTISIKTYSYPSMKPL